ncbi:MULTISPECIES: bactofilin family protein [Halobacteriovorax]|uniref:Polymer-forming cytoskeletal protein n=1 Tax=Halobacteriovorax vibrionivorans TaxID=2152716 RepID=A0ABY0IKM6_9BACT|nr:MULTISPECIES: polymer-forming cytoskeletal protein [Halobacteriovorax]AYF46020.1 polymer-forming cytoskeletal family protein [Halobacteriovorax sp. BALOs_7]RZF23045.1 polymer-forming cytoskeletal protein [Halobacteriovorax vibrionivorans]TGD49324.1 polymer-forming cytoskeletal protein [Halobacteriovorax sp. Y22]
MTQGTMAAIIEDGCKLEGNITLNGVGRIAGIVNGTIYSNDTVIISEAAVINADIIADVIMISGIVKGDIKATSRVEIIKPARFEGTITTPSLIVEDGVIFHGTTKMHDDK